MWKWERTRWVPFGEHMHYFPPKTELILVCNSLRWDFSGQSTESCMGSSLQMK